MTNTPLLYTTRGEKSLQYFCPKLAGWCPEKPNLSSSLKKRLLLGALYYKLYLEVHELRVHIIIPVTHLHQRERLLPLPSVPASRHRCAERHDIHLRRHRLGVPEQPQGVFPHPFLPAQADGLAKKLREICFYATAQRDMAFPTGSTGCACWRQEHARDFCFFSRERDGRARAAYRFFSISLRFDANSFCYNSMCRRCFFCYDSMQIHSVTNRCKSIWL